jgi:hypothetical protein
VVSSNLPQSEVVTATSEDPDPARRPRPVRLAYQPPANSTFLSEQISHQQLASSTFLSEQTSNSHQPAAKRTGCKLLHLLLPLPPQHSATRLAPWQNPCTLPGSTLPVCREKPCGSVSTAASSWQVIVMARWILSPTSSSTQFGVPVHSPLAVILWSQ